MVDFSLLNKELEGTVDQTSETLENYSHDASLIKIAPTLVAFPKNSSDIQKLVAFVNKNKGEEKTLSLTARSAGTCMSGGSINESIIVDCLKYLSQILEIKDTPHEYSERVAYFNDDTYGSHGKEGYAVVEPGVFYRVFEQEVTKHDLYLPSYTASKDINALGGMFGNNSGGEKSIKFGKTEDYIMASKMILADTHEYDIHPLTIPELDAAIAKGDFYGNALRDLRKLIDANYDFIMSQKPQVSKNSAGYYLWNVYNKDKTIFNPNKLFVGAQGTLGISTQATMRLFQIKHHRKMVVIFLPEISHLGDLVAEIMKYSPDSLESYDDESMKLAVKFFGDIVHQMGLRESAKLGLHFIPEAMEMLRGGVPKLVVLVEFLGDTQEEVDEKARNTEEQLKLKFDYHMRIPTSEEDEEKYWKIRHESFNLLRKHVKGKRTAPFIDDIIVKPEALPTFLPELEALLKQYDLQYTIAGHAGNGNFHIIPLMDMEDAINIPIIDKLSEQVYDLVVKYKGSITAEHNDGIIRTPYLGKMFDPKMLELFKQVKQIFDPLGIFNPNKKVGGTKEYMIAHLSRENVHN